jgi:hypothetical protein
MSHCGHYNLPVDRTTIERVTDVVVAWPIELLRARPEAVLFLLRRYVATGDLAVRAAAEAGLTAGLASLDAERDPWRRIEWLHALGDAASVSDGSELAALVGRALPGAVDAMEHAVRQAYEPGDGLVGASCRAHLAAASALLAAFDMTGRLPYPMLAEELLLACRRRWWNEATARFDVDAGADPVAARVLCRLAALQADSEYAGRVRVAHERRHRRDAQRLLSTLAGGDVFRTEHAAVYGLALLDWFALDSILQ